MNYFNTCKTLDDAKNLFKKLCFDLHPDTSNKDSQSDFIQMFAQFKAFKPSADHAREEDKNFNAESFYNIVQRFNILNSVLVTFIGSFIWLEDQPGAEGSTKAQKETIKSIILEGYNAPKFAFKRLKWYYSPEGYRQKFSSKKTFEEIKKTWGSQSYKPRETHKLQTA